MQWRRIFAEGEFDLKTELIAGITTFVTSAYIIAVNPMILSQAGMDQTALIAITCIASAVATFFMALWPKAPVLLAPGMGLNAFFAYTVVGTLGYTWQQALGFVFWAGFLFLLLSLIGFREKIAAAIPLNLRLAGSVGIGLFIAFIGFRNLGLIRVDGAGLMHLAKIGPTQALGLVGLAIMAMLEAMQKRGALLAGIVVVSVLSFLLGYAEPPAAWFSAPPDISPIAGQLELIPPARVATVLAILTFLYVALFDGLGTLIAVSEAFGLARESNYEKRLARMLMTDSTANMIGAALGTSTVTAYIESNTGISQGGRTGWTAFFCAILFLLALFFIPFVAAIPAYATAPALIIVGVFMVREISRINLSQWDEALPAFLTIALMPLTTSIATGLMFGFLCFTLLKILLRKWTDLNPVLIGITIFSAFNLIVGGRF